MLITLSNIIEIKDPTKDILDYCKNELTFKNPDYIKKQKLGFWIGKTPKNISLYDIYDNKSSVISDEYEISINKILLGNENICGLNSIFQIDMTQLLGILYELENNNFIRVIRTGGLDVIHIPKEKSYCDCIKEYYDSLIN